jgi:2-dehydropantoate 2-reductase
MNMDAARILIIGAGVNGSVCAANFSNAGIDITVLARGKRTTELLEEGIVIEDPFTKKRSVTRVRVITQLDPDDRYDFVLVIIRKNQVTELLPVLAQNKSPNIVFMGNNLTGPAEFVQSLGKERVMMGSVYAAGKRDGSIIRAITAKSVAAPFGELDGSITPRLKRLASIFRQAGLKVETSTNIVDAQATHAVGVALIGSLTLKYGCNTSALARSKDDLELYIQAKDEALQVLRLSGHKIIPWSEVMTGRMPVFLQVAGLRALLGSKLGEVGLAWHCSQAPDEVQQLAKELEGLVNQSDLAAPAIRKLLGPAQ